jgi:hypothetical protein
MCGGRETALEKMKNSWQQKKQMEMMVASSC